MNSIIYTCCQTEYCLARVEADWRLEWSPVPPQLGAVVSMGAEARWCIVKITVYQPTTTQAVDSVYLAHLHPVGRPVPPDVEWDSEPMMDSVQSLLVEAVAIGKEELGLSPTDSVNVPKVGDQVESDIDPMDEDMIIYDPPKSWTMRQVVLYLPVMEMRLTTPEEAHYARAFICWCESSEIVSKS
ncbi:hypothetical protein H6F86_24540 [Phormidium sp. FACHB-592]|uniref:Uncharacterized protein n=1 Tax=Stenomitos frigidus AS-A4 TaxID=2933935 RepID=A0ABV0KMX8_9CYAN|nr:hypothetical protein [Phormidium sp. FACHB-592]MBD2076996.1 hypothetical protein [Phormidium sp. FACHB-592]